MLYRLLSVTTILLSSSHITCEVIENNTDYTMILHSFSAHGRSLDIPPKELSPHNAINNMPINFTRCLATTYRGEKFCIIDVMNQEQPVSINHDSLMPTNKTPEELQAFKKMISKLRRFEPLIIIPKSRKSSELN
ncbi:hypothetical protein KJZ61_04155 [Candidatus Dependentiae bacterium]|nr:hypothetical protein [Candidatus Dependentiae bacterium]